MLAKTMSEHSQTIQSRRLSQPLQDAVVFSLVLQAPLLLLASLATDGGRIFQIFFFACVAFNFYLVSALLFRPKSPTKFDFIFIRAGYLPIIIATYFLSNWVWDLRGL